MKYSFSELKTIKKATQQQMMASYSEKEAAEMALVFNKTNTEMKKRMRCFRCEKKFNELDKKTIGSRPDWTCVACFTSNA